VTLGSRNQAVFADACRDRYTAAIMVMPTRAANEGCPLPMWAVRLDPGTWLQLREAANGRSMESFVEEILSRHLAYFSMFSGKL
jgi:hypothetical protein